MQPVQQPKPVPRSAQRRQDSQAAMLLTERLNNMERRLRILEDRYGNLRKKTQLTDQNLISFEKELSKEVRAISEQVIELKRQTEDVNDKALKMYSELDKAARKHELKVVEKYLDLWQPTIKKKVESGKRVAR